MRTGAEYRDALRDGRRVWVMGEGLVEDVTTHPATRAMVEEYIAWYDRHFDPEWSDVLFSPPDGRGEGRPWAYAVPKSADDLRGMGRSFSKTTFLSAGNTHPHPGLWEFDRAGCRHGGARLQRLTATDRQCARLSRAYRRHGAVSDLLRRCRTD